MSGTAPMSTPSARDRIRQAVVVLSMVLALIGSFIGSGAAGGTPIAQAAGGALSADATRIAPAAPAFTIWSVIYLGLAGYTLWQLRPARAADPRQRALGYPVALSLLLNAAWILSVQAGLLWVSVIVIALLVVVLALALRTCWRRPGHGWVEALLVDGVLGLYLGWVCIATLANVTAALVAAGITGFGRAEDVLAGLVLLVAGAIGVGLSLRDGGRAGPALALCWGLAWIAVARFGGEPHSLVAGTAALVAAVAIATATVLRRVAMHSRARA